MRKFPCQTFLFWVISGSRLEQSAYEMAHSLADVSRKISGSWKTQARMPPAAKIDLTPENNLLLTPEEFGRRGQFYFGLSAFEGFEFTDAFTG